MLFALREPQRCVLSEHSNTEVGISFGIVACFGLFGLLAYSILAMFIIELPFPFHPYVSRLEKAYRRRFQALSQFNETVLGGLS